MANGVEFAGFLILAFLGVLPLVPVVFFAQRATLRKDRSALRPLAIFSVAAMVVYAVVCADGFLLEPNWPRVVHLEVTGAVSKPLTILQLSDLHLEKDTPAREAWLADRLKELHPDLILLTGDIHQMENMDAGILRAKLGGITAPLGVFACSGYDHVGAIQEAAPGIQWLENEAVVLRRGGDVIGLAGLNAFGNRAPVYAALGEATFRIAMHHTPGLADEAAAAGMHLYLCGHTHGGQVRIPLWGAVITNSPTGKRFERGLRRAGAMPVHTSSGLGLEPPPAPQVRFLCRPEITLITVVP